MISKINHSHSHSHSQSHSHPNSAGHTPLRRPRSRSGSLSIARSPSVLSSGTFFTPPIPQFSGSGSGSGAGDLESASASASTSAGAATGVEGPLGPAGGGGGGGGGVGLRRVVSNHSRLPTSFTPLDAIQSAEDLPSLALVTETKDDMALEHRLERERRLAYNSQPQPQPHPYHREPRTYAHTDRHEKDDIANGDEDADADAEVDRLAAQGTDVQIPLLGVSPTHAKFTHRIDSDTLSVEDELGLVLEDEEEYDGPFQPPDSKELLSILASVSAVCVLAFAAGMTTIFDWVL